MEDRLAGELMDAINNAGGAVKKKDETHKRTNQAMGEAERSLV